MAICHPGFVPEDGLSSKITADPLTFYEAARAIGVPLVTLKAWRERGHVVTIVLPDGTELVPAVEVDRLKGTKQEPID